MGGINPQQCGDQTKANDIQKVQVTTGLKKKHEVAPKINVSQLQSK